ncbi:MAG: carboxypeptidase-like regulatory domain-containing protein, partial [Acidobacteriia bacterium]|nr:carboxypeptidase-like regulatory domain-containing protein [Terriglobia bacterium]
GKYRLEDLKPGYYVVSAGTLGPLDAHRDERDRTGARLYPLTYYPNAGGIASAATVTVIEDTETSGVDIRVTRTPAFALKGKVVGAPPEGIAGLGLGFHGQTPGFAQLTAPKPDGSFEYPAVAPGSYWLSIFPMHAGGLASVLMPIEVTDHEIEDIALVYAPYVELAGRIVMDSEKAPPKDVTITADPEDSTFSVDAAAAEDGSFTLKRLHRAVYAVGLKGLAGAYVKSMRYQGREVSESGVDLNAGAADTLQITLRSAGAQVSGVAQDEDHKPVPGAAVALVSDSGRHLVFKTAIADQHGAFRIQGVAPGDYKTVAVEDIDPASLEDPQVFQRFAGRAEKLALKENDRKELSLTVAR